MTQHFVFDELSALLAEINPEMMLSFRISRRSQTRLECLLEKTK
jgi:hypothetical protein